MSEQMIGGVPYSINTTEDYFQTMIKYFSFTPKQAVMYFGVINTPSECWPGSLIDRLKAEPSMCHDIATEVIAAWCKDALPDL